MEGPSGVVALVLLETAAGATAFLWLTGLWGNVKRGYFVLTSSVALACALLATLAASGAVPAAGGTPSAAPGAAGLRLAVVATSATSVLLGLSLSALILRLDAAGRALGLGATVAAGAALVASARAVDPSFGSALLQLAAGAAFMGAVAGGLLLGHWYLVDRRLRRDHIRRYAVLLLAAVVLEAAVIAALGFGRPAGEGFSPILQIAGLSTWLALGMVACTALIAVLIRATLKGAGARAVQAATGFFYLAVITAFTAEMAAKAGFVG
ncbi:MAG TPA: hypothetical protein VHL78_10515 [Actinomycetota bacterium]|nr:hypothetical protein [Actinomycetota bacterium]